MKEKPIIELFMIRGLGLIIPFKSGVIYSNQTGGFACNHPECEGVYIPLYCQEINVVKELYDFFSEGEKWRGWCCEGIDKETADIVDEILKKSESTENLSVDRNKLKFSQEAWIYVKINWDKDDECAEIRGFDIDEGILTWENSD